MLPMEILRNFYGALPGSGRLEETYTVDFAPLSDGGAIFFGLP
jgi:hypothetical protein